MKKIINFIIYKYRHKIGIPLKDAKRIENELNRALIKSDDAYYRHLHLRKNEALAHSIKEFRKRKPCPRL